jgi:hypothetical protein
VRLGSSGRNALDFTLAYYVGRAVAADPTGFFHIVSKDAGYDPLIEHRRSKHIRAHRHNDFTKLSFSSPAKVPPSSLPVAAPDLKSKSKPKSQKPRLEEWETRVLEHFSRASTTRPRSQKKLISYLIAFFGQKITEAEALDRIERLSQAGQLVINEKGVVTYHMERE